MAPHLLEPWEDRCSQSWPDTEITWEALKALLLITVPTGAAITLPPVPLNNLPRVFTKQSLQLSLVSASAFLSCSIRTTKRRSFDVAQAATSIKACGIFSDFLVPQRFESGAQPAHGHLFKLPGRTTQPRLRSQPPELARASGVQDCSRAGHGHCLSPL